MSDSVSLQPKVPGFSEWLNAGEPKVSKLPTEGERLAVMRALKTLNESEIATLLAPPAPNFTLGKSELPTDLQQKFRAAMHTREARLQGKEPYDPVKTLLDSPSDQDGSDHLIREQATRNFYDQLQVLANEQKKQPGSCSIITKESLAGVEKRALILTGTPYKTGDITESTFAQVLVETFDACHVKQAPRVEMPSREIIEAAGKDAGDIRMGAVNALLKDHPGVFVGRTSYQEDVPKFLLGYMQEFADKGGKFLFYQGSESGTSKTYGHADELMRDPAEELAKILEMNAEGPDESVQSSDSEKLDHRVFDEYELRMYQAANKLGIKLINIDPDGVSLDIDDLGRIGRANYVWTDVVRQTLADQPEGTKYLVAGGAKRSQYPSNGDGRVAQALGIPTVIFSQFSGKENFVKSLAIDNKNNVLVFNTDSDDLRLSDQGNISVKGESESRGKLDPGVSYLPSGLPEQQLQANDEPVRKNPMVNTETREAKEIREELMPESPDNAETAEDAALMPALPDNADGNAATSQDASAAPEGNGEAPELKENRGTSDADTAPSHSLAKGNRSLAGRAQNLEEDDQLRLKQIIKTDILRDLQTCFGILYSDRRLADHTVRFPLPANVKHAEQTHLGEQIKTRLKAGGYENLVQNFLKAPGRPIPESLHIPEEALAEITKQALADFDVEDFNAEVERRTSWMDNNSFRNEHPTWDDAWAEVSKAALEASWHKQKAEKPQYDFALGLLQELSFKGGEKFIPSILDMAAP